MTHRMKYWLYCALAFGAAAGAGVVMGLSLPAGSGSENPAVVLPLMLGLCGLVMMASWLWWKKTDDLQQHGQLISWYWGGMSGALAMLTYLSVYFGRHSEVSLGAIYLFFAQAAGFAVVWLVWRLRGRGHSE